MFYKNIRSIRKEKGMNQEQLAELIGVKRAVVSKYETGAVPLTVEQLQKIAVALDVPVEHIIKESKSPLSWAETGKVLAATPQRTASINNGETVSGNTKMLISDYMGCSFPSLLGEEDYVPQKTTGKSRNIPTEIIDILDSVAHNDDYRKIQIQISKVIAHNLKAKGISKEHLQDLCKISKPKVEALFEGGDSGKSKIYGFNLSDLIRIWREFGLSIDYLLTGEE
jgi:transcriptional regulator with XRE-family HTH domain